MDAFESGLLKLVCCILVKISQCNMRLKEIIISQHSALQCMIITKTKLQSLKPFLFIQAAEVNTGCSLVDSMQQDTRNYQWDMPKILTMSLTQCIGILDFLNEDFSAVKLLRVLFFAYAIGSYWIFYHFVGVVCFFGEIIWPSLFLFMKTKTALGFWQLCLFCLEQNKIEIVLTGDELDFGESSLVIANHRSLSDFSVLAYLVRVAAGDDDEKASQLTPELNFFTWATLWRVPTIRLFFNIMNHNENWRLNDSELDYELSKLNGFVDSTNHYVDEYEVNKVPEWLVLFPEVNVYSTSDLVSQKRVIEKHHVPESEMVLYPRFSAFCDIVKRVKTNTKFSKVYSLTILYYQKPDEQEEQKETNSHHYFKQSAPLDNAVFHSPSLLKFFTNGPFKTVVRVHIKSKNISRLPNKNKKLEKWLEKEWVIKDKLSYSMQRSIKNFL